MGSCFAQNVAGYLNINKGIAAFHFPETTHYNTVSTLQELKHLLVEPQYDRQDMWVTEEGIYAHPFRRPGFRASSYGKLKQWSDTISSQASKLLSEADIIIITLGGTEVWRHPKTKKVYLTIPFPDIFNHQMPEIAEFHNLTFQENYTALEEIYFLVRKYIPKAHIIFTVSPNRMTFTVSEKDVTLATCQGKSTLRAAVGELTDKYRDHLHYFHSYEIVEFATFPHLFFDHQQRHVSSFAVTVIMNEFVRFFCTEELEDKSEYHLVQKMIKDQTPQYHIEHGHIISISRIHRFVIKALQRLRMNRLANIIYDLRG
jgi:hypothetical protein